MKFQVTEYSVCGISLAPYAITQIMVTREIRDHSPLGQSHLGGAVIYCSILAVAITGIFCVISLLLSSSNKSADVHV